MTRRRTAALPKRTPSGQLSRAVDRVACERLVEAHSPAQIRRLRDAALRNMAAPEWGSELGRLFLEAKLTATQYEAGRRFAALSREYHAALGAPGYPTASLAQNIHSRHEEGQGAAIRQMAAIHHYDEAIASLRASLPILEPLVRLVCERDATVSSSESLRHFQAALDLLAAHWGIPA